MINFWYSVISKASNGSESYILDHCGGIEATNKCIDNIYTQKRTIIGIVPDSKYHKEDLEKIVRQTNQGEINEEQLKTLIKFIQRKSE